MSAVRAMRDGDVPAVAELVSRAGGGDVERIERELRAVFVEHPWRDDAVCSLVADDDAGKLQAFLGVLPRPMTWRGRPVRAAVATRLVIHPDCREFVGVRLLRALLAGPQDLSLMDGARCATRSVWERLGGSAAVAYGVSWVRPLRPAAWALSRARARLGGVASLAAPIARLADAAIDRVPRNPLRVPHRAASREVADAELARWIDDVAGARLHACYDAASLAWTLARAAERARAPLVRLVVDGRRKGTRGWCVMTVPPRGVAHVLQMAVRGDAGDDVVRAALVRAHEAGCVAVAGRVAPGLLIDLSDRAAVMHATGSHLLVHARDESLARHVEKADALLGRHDGEGLAG